MEGGRRSPVDRFASGERQSGGKDARLGDPTSHRRSSTGAKVRQRGNYHHRCALALAVLGSQAPDPHALDLRDTSACSSMSRQHCGNATRRATGDVVLSRSAPIPLSTALQCTYSPTPHTGTLPHYTPHQDLRASCCWMAAFQLVAIGGWRAYSNPPLSQTGGRSASKQASSGGPPFARPPSHSPPSPSTIRDTQLGYEGPFLRLTYGRRGLIGQPRLYLQYQVLSPPDDPTA